MATTPNCKETSAIVWSAPPGTKLPSWKRAFDLVAIFLALPFLIPALLAISVLIKLLSRGPVVFKQERIGYQGKPFLCLKFRTMHVNANSSGHEGHLENLMASDVPMTKLDKVGDPRLIRFGRLLRSSGLDELPQFFNVMRGEMSLVGPRPCTTYEYARYQERQKLRFNAYPGITGLWQVSGKNQTTFNEMIRLDILYASKMSLFLDITIALKTVPVLLKQVAEIARRRSRPNAGHLRKGQTPAAPGRL